MPAHLQPNIHLRRLTTLTPHSLLLQTQLITRAFAHDAFLSAMLGSDGVEPPGEEVMLAYMRPKVRAIMERDERAALGWNGGEWWVAEVVPPAESAIRADGETELDEQEAEEEAERQIVGMAMWFRPGFQYLETPCQRKRVGIQGFLDLLSPEMLRWFTNYYSPKLEEMCNTAYGLGARKENWQLHGLAVEPEWQGKGMGRALMDVVAMRVLGEGKRVLWETVTDLDVEIYKRWGAVERGNIPVETLTAGTWTVHAMELPASARPATRAE